MGVVPRSRARAATKRFSSANETEVSSLKRSMRSFIGSSGKWKRGTASAAIHTGTLR